MPILFSNATVLPMTASGGEPRTFTGWVGTDGDRIALATASEADAAAFRAAHPGLREIDCRGKLVMPGLVNTHCHAAMTLQRSYADDISLMAWLHDYIWPFEAHQTPDDVKLGMTLGIVEMLLGGVTSFVDMYYFEDRCVEVAERLGIRALLGCNYFDTNADEVLPRVGEAVRLAAAGSGRVRIAVAPHSPYTVSPENLLRGKELADRITVFIHPRTVRLDTLNAGVPRDLEGQPSGQIVDDDLDFYGLREYEPGDDVRNVHWLSSAKTGTLMIRQYEATRRTDTSVTISVNPDEYVNGEEFEMAVSIHSSIGVKCLLQDRPLFCHAGNAHGQPRNAMEFLDNASAIEPDREDNPNLAEGTLKHSPDASFYFFTVGSLKDIEQIKRMTLALPRSATGFGLPTDSSSRWVRLALPRSASCVVLQASAGANRGIRRFANFTLATIGDLDDLPLIMGVLA